MKKIKLLLVSVIALLLVGCGYEETKEYELLTVRRYSKTTESGIFATKENTDWYIEFTFQTGEGIKKETFNEKYEYQMEIKEENKVVCEKGTNVPILHITIEKYKELYGLGEEGGIE